MPDITSIIETVIAAILAERRAMVSRTAKTELLLLAFAALCAGTGLFFLVLALYQYLGSWLAPPVAACASAVAVFGIAVLAMITRELIKYKRASGPKPVHDEFSETIHSLIASLRNELEEPIRENPKMSVAIAALTGLLAARRV